LLDTLIEIPKLVQILTTLTQVYYNLFGLGSAMAKRKKHDCDEKRKKKKKRMR